MVVRSRLNHITVDIKCASTDGPITMGGIFTNKSLLRIHWIEKILYRGRIIAGQMLHLMPAPSTMASASFWNWQRQGRIR